MAEITPPTPTLVRNSDSWRLAYLVSEIDGLCLVYSDGPDLWSSKYAEPISASSLDAALMDLYREHRDAYDRFLAIMMGWGS